MPAFFEKELLVTGLHAKFLKGRMPSQLNGTFNSDGVHGMLEVEDFQFIDMGFFSSLGMWRRLLNLLRTLI